jgi:two-component system, cell cycle sensor histidine kinase and response regulator CckA
VRDKLAGKKEDSCNRSGCIYFKATKYLGRVSDTGIGMDKEVQEHIFDPFYTTKEKGKGTGLGLSTIYGIVKQSNGFIWAYSEPGQGSTFKIYLPKAKRDVKEEKKEQPPVENLSGSETVLIVEDNNSLRKLAQKSLQPHGYRILVAENGEDALRISEEHEGTIENAPPTNEGNLHVRIYGRRYC